jgi:hypothetical protein
MKTVKNKLQYKNQITLFGKLRRRFHEMIDMSYEQIVVAKLPITLENYKYFNRHLVKINKAFKDSLFLTLNKSEYAGEMGYTAVVSLKVKR